MRVRYKIRTPRARCGGRLRGHERRWRRLPRAERGAKVVPRAFARDCAYETLTRYKRACRMRVRYKIRTPRARCGGRLRGHERRRRTLPRAERGAKVVQRAFARGYG